MATSTQDVAKQNEQRVRGGLLKNKRKYIPPQLVEFDVTLDDEHRVYFAGETLTGQVKVKLTDGLPLQGIILRIVGEAYANVSDEPRPWTAARKLSQLRKTLRTNKISPGTFSNQSTQPSSSFFCASEQPNWENVTLSTDTAPRSVRSTLQRDEQLSPPSATNGLKLSKKKRDELSQKFRAHEKYFEHKMYVFGHRYSSSRELMWSGDHVFPFSYDLPTKLPSSFHGRFGYVRYFCEASLERLNQPTIQKIVFFSVGSVMDLNADSKADTGVDKEKKTNSWCFCCPSGTIIVSAKIKKRGFVPGEMIPIQAFVLNVSNKPIYKICARVVQIATYFSSKGLQKRSDETILAEKVESLLPPGESSAWDEVGPCIPPCPASSTMIDCKLITVDYRLEFVLDIYKAKEPLILRMPLRIGSIPMEKSFRNLMDEAPAELSDFIRTFPASVTAKYSSLPCTVSLKCVKGDRNVNRYYFKQIPRSMHSMLGLSTHLNASSKVSLQPLISDDTKSYAPRYLTFLHKPKANQKTLNGIGNGSIFQPKKKTLGTESHQTPFDAETVRINEISSNGPSTLCSPTSLKSNKSEEMNLAERLEQVLTISNNNGREGLHFRGSASVMASESDANATTELKLSTEDKKSI